MSHRVLYVTNQDPNGVGGGCYASHAYLKAFSRIFHGKIDLCIAEECNEQDKDIKLAHTFRIKPRNKTQKVLSIFNGRMHRFTKPVKRLICENNYDYCVLDHNKLAGSLIRKLKQRKIKVITIHHNYEPEFFKDNCTNLWYRIFYMRHVVRSERLAYLMSDINLFLTKDDLEKFIKVYGNCNGKCSVIGTFEYSEIQFPVINSNNSETITIAITGSLNNEQGIDGVKFFIKDLYPNIDKSNRIIIAGKQPTQEIVSLCDCKSNIQLVPNPKSMNDILCQAQIYICPTRLGGGLKLRIMDGLRLGLPVLTHKCSARGYDLFFDKPYFRVFSDSASFQVELDNLIRFIKGVNNYKEDCRNHYQSVFSFISGLDRIKKAIEF